MRPQAAADRSPVAAADAPSFYLAASRPFLESHVPARVRVLPNLRFRCDIVGLATTPDGRRVTGVRVLRPRRAAVARGRLQHREAVPAAQAEWIAGCMIAPREVGAVPSYGQASRAGPEDWRTR